ncbi:MAG: hypothetical protein HZB79_09940 [Deltaproteobacteria bacterium]|nr:hypothetical protein [Deltaproteobacteria bacterium]
MNKMTFFLVVLILTVSSVSFAREVPYTQEDRDRLIRVEVKVEEGLKAVNQRIDGLDKRIDGLDKRIDSLDKRIDGLQSIMIGGFGIIATGMIAIVGFVLWDRRTALAPAIRKSKELEEDLASEIRKRKELEERELMLEKAIKDYAHQEPKLAEILRAARLL